MLLRDGEVVEAIVHGQLYGTNAVVILTNARLLIVNDREFKPDVIEIPVDASISVQGWQADRSAALLIQRSELTAQVERIADKPLAQEMDHPTRRDNRIWICQ